MKKLNGIVLRAVFLLLISSGVHAGVMYTMDVNGPGSSADFIGLTELTLEGSCALSVDFSACKDFGEGGGADPVDWYSWTAPTDGQLSVSIFFTNALMDIDLGLVRSNGSVLASSATSNDGESINLGVTVGSTYFINVYSFSESGANDAYSADSFETNNSRDSAAALNPAPTPVPEPSTLAITGLGLAGLVGWRRRKKS